MSELKIIYSFKKLNSFPSSVDMPFFSIKEADDLRGKRHGWVKVGVA